MGQDHKNGFIKRCREAEKLAGDIKADLPLDDPGQSLGELALAEPLIYKMRIVGHMFKSDKYTDQIVEWGTFLSVDVGMCALMAHNFKCPLQWIDIPEYAHDKKFGPVWDHVAMHVCLKKVFGIDCLEEDLKIEQIYQLAAAAHLQPVHIMRADQAIEATIAPGIHTLGTHTRDLYMQWKIQQICENNPGKTILAVMG